MTTAGPDMDSLFPRKRRHGVRVSTWYRPTDHTARRNAQIVRALREEIEHSSNDDLVPITVGQIREWLDGYEPQPVVRGAEIKDHQLGARYRVTLDETISPPTIKTIEVTSLGVSVDDRIFRIPVRSIVQEVLTLQGYATSSGVDVVIGARGGGQPTPEHLLALINSSLKRKDIGEMYGRSEARVDQWLRAARAARPDLPWPAKQPNQHSQSKKEEK